MVEATGSEQVQHPLEPLLRKLIKGYVDEDDLNSKLVGLFEVHTSTKREREKKTKPRSFLYGGTERLWIMTTDCSDENGMLASGHLNGHLIFPYSFACNLKDFPISTLWLVLPLPCCLTACLLS